MARRPHHYPDQSSPHNTGNEDPEVTSFGDGWSVWTQKWLCIAGILALGLTSCSAAPSPPTNANVLSPEGEAEVEFIASPNLSQTMKGIHGRVYAKARRFIVPDDAIAIALYTPNDQCSAFITEDVLVPRQTDLPATIELILSTQEIPLFELTGYRLNLEPETNTAIIDLRVSRTSPRLLQSLSFCEQQALLGSLKETLVNHPTWGIEQVEFTNRGHRLVM